MWKSKGNTSGVYLAGNTCFESLSGHRVHRLSFLLVYSMFGDKFRDSTSKQAATASFYFLQNTVITNNFTILVCKHLETTDKKVKVKWSHYRLGVAQRMGTGIALLFHYRGTRREWVVSSTPRPHFTSGKDSVPILQVAGWAPGQVWTGEKSRPHRDSIPDRPACSHSLNRLSYLAHLKLLISSLNKQ